MLLTCGEDLKPARKKYSKHVKAIFQIGDKQTDDYKTVLGYPIEFIPLSNPYTLKIGDELAMKLLINGKPISGEMVYASFNTNMFMKKMAHHAMLTRF